MTYTVPCSPKWLRQKLHLHSRFLKNRSPIIFTEAPSFKFNGKIILNFFVKVFIFIHKKGAFLFGFFVSEPRLIEACMFLTCSLVWSYIVSL